MSTQGEQILKQLRRYEDGKRDYVYSSNSSMNNGGHSTTLGAGTVAATGSGGSTEANEDELLNSQIELMQLATSPGTMVRQTLSGASPRETALRTTAPTTTTTTRSSRHYTSLKILASEPRYFPPLNFGVVESDLYRCGHPQTINYPFLESLKLRTIIYVGDKTNSWEYYRWIKSQPGEIAFVHVPLDLAAAASASSSNDDKLNYLLSVVAHSANYPILIHSNKGKHRVGVVVALIRKILQGWVLAAVYDEYGKYAKHGKDNSELQFIEFFRSHVPVPATAADAPVGASVPRFIDADFSAAADAPLPPPRLPHRAR